MMTCRYFLNPIKHTILAGSLFWLSTSTSLVSAQDQSNAPVKLRTLDDHSPFQVPGNKEDWLKRKAELRDQLNVALGLVPYPKLAPLKPQVYGTHAGDGFQVHKVVVETLPGLYLTGSLFTPPGDLAQSKKLPAVLSPHGHWTDGRMYRCNDKELGALLASGAERFESAARNHIQARCVQLARMGCVAFAYDMLGNADNQQISIERAHGYGNNSVNPAGDESRFLFYSPQAESYQQNVMGVQAVNSSRALDFLLSLSYVDAERVSITGASGGGTQSFLAAALDDRLCGAFPAVMVSTEMQGGCTCENAPYLRTDTGNIEMAAMIAPRPMGLTAADDWTKNVGRDGFPELRGLYQLFDAKDKVTLFQATHFPHNYNHVSRVAMYGFMNQLFGLGKNDPILEKDFEYLDRKVLSVYDDQHPAPPGGLDFERQLVKAWQKDVDAHFALPSSSDSVNYMKSSAGKDLSVGWNVITSFAETWSKNSTIEYSWALDQEQPRVVIKNKLGQPIASGLISTGNFVQRGRSGQAKIDWTGVQSVEISISSISKPQPTSETMRIAISIDDRMLDELDLQNEQVLVPSPRPVAAYTYGYNAPSIVRRTGVLLTLVDSLKSNRPELKIKLTSQGSNNFLAAGAALRRPTTITSLSLADGNKFRFASINSFRHKDFLPGAMRYQDMPGLVLCVTSSGVAVTEK